MWNPNATMGYDRGVLYSPQGRIIQTEYAREAMRRGSLSIAIRSNAGVVLAGQIRVSDLDLPNKKISKIDDHFSAIFAGFAADGRVLIQRARVETQVHKMTYGEATDIKHVATRLADYAHMFTQQGGLRPLGIGLLLGGIDVDGEPKIYFINPGGGLWESKAKAVGSGDAKATEYLSKYYKDDATIEELEKLAKDSIKFAASGSEDIDAQSTKNSKSDSGKEESTAVKDEEIEIWKIEAVPENIPHTEKVY